VLTGEELKEIRSILEPESPKNRQTPEHKGVILTERLVPGR
jgi:hypothetical protein